MLCAVTQRAENVSSVPKMEKLFIKQAFDIYSLNEEFSKN